MDKEAREARDEAVIATNDDAFICKVSTTQAGYYTDAYLNAMHQATGFDTSKGGSKRKPPLINRGTFARVTTVERLVSGFLRQCASRGELGQVISLGAGYDTLPFRLLNNMSSGGGTLAGGCVRYTELDFEDVVRTKSRLIRKVRLVGGLFDRFTQLGNDGSDGMKARGCDCDTFEYALHKCDLRTLDSVDAALSACGVNRARGCATLFLTECVLMYLKPEDSDGLVKHVNGSFTGLRYFVNYEAIGPDDAFGRRMIQNIARRGSPLLGITAYPDVKSQEARFLRCGWAQARGFTMRRVFDGMYGFKERIALNRIEVLDELEEWNLIMDHYALVVSSNGCDKQLQDARSSIDELIDELRLQ